MNDRVNELFEKHDGEYLEFERVENKRSNSPDLHAFLLLDEIYTLTTDIVDCAEHDEIWLSVEGESLDRLTEEQIIELHRCGVRYSDEYDCLCMFV